MAASASTNTGLNLLDAGVTEFDNDPVLLLLLTILIAGGKNCYPITLRVYLWLKLRVHLLLPRTSEQQKHIKTLRFLLDHPRRFSTHLFPSHHTWGLLSWNVVLYGLDWGFFEATDRYADKWSRAKRALMGYFTTISNRHAGMLLTPLTEVNSAYWPVVYIFTLIGIWPYAIMLRNSNVLQERSLGHSMPIYAGDNRNRDHPGLVARIAQTFMPRSILPSNTGWNLLYEQLAAQQSYSAFNFVFFSTVLVFIEGIRKVDDQARWFKLLFEAGSAYAGTGMSMPADGSSTSLSAEFNVGG